MALFLAQRKVLLFNEQDFADKGPGFAVEFGKYFGRLHVHPSSGSPRGHQELHITYRRPEKVNYKESLLIVLQALDSIVMFRMKSHL